MDTAPKDYHEKRLPEGGIFFNTIPVLDAKDNVWGYFVDFLAADSERTLDGAQVAAITSGLDPAEVVGARKAIVTVDERSFNTAIDARWEDRAILQMPAAHVVRHVSQANRRTRLKTIFCATNFVMIETILPLLPSPVFLALDVGRRDEGELLQFMQAVEGKAVTAIARSVDTFSDFESCTRAGFHLFQGEFFIRPDTTRRLSISPGHSLLLELSAQVAQDADIAKVEAIFKKNPDLSTGLMNLVRSAYFRTSRDISSIRHAITVLGYENIDKWVALMLFSISGSDPWANPLFERAFLRARTMELLTRSVLGHRALGDAAYLIGILSLMPLIFDVTMEEVLAKAGVTREIKQALLDRQGVFGTFLALVERLEKADYELIRQQATRAGLKPATVLAARTGAIKEYHARAIGQQAQQPAHVRPPDTPAVPIERTDSKQDSRPRPWFRRLFSRKDA